MKIRRPTVASIIFETCLSPICFVIFTLIAACKLNGTNYSQFMNGLKKAGINLNRKMLSELAIHDAPAFTALVEKAKAAL